MKILRTVITSILGLTLFACGGGGDSSSASYVGIWHSIATDDYLEIKSDNSADLRQCSVNDGYRVTETGTVNGDNLNYGSFTFNLSQANDKLTIKENSSGSVVELVKVTSIPSVCTGDAIEITFSSPTTATENTLTTFTVNFDYRLASKASGIVYFGFNTSNPNEFVLSNSTFEITQAETGSGSLSADAMPAFYASPDSFKVYINLSENPHPSPWTPLASDTVAVTVTKAAPFVSNNVFQNSTLQTEKSEICEFNMLTQCE